MNKEKHIGIIGLGNMGKGLAINIINKGYKISVFNNSFFCHFFLLTKKCDLVEKICYVFIGLFLIVFSTVLDTKSANTKAETLSTHKSVVFKNLAK